MTHTPLTTGTTPHGALHPAAANKTELRRAGWAGFIGTVLENYDMVVYGVGTAIIFNTLFFPNVSPAVGFIASFGAYAVGFVARPMGGLFFSRYGDKMAGSSSWWQPLP